MALRCLWGSAKINPMGGEMSYRGCCSFRVVSSGSRGMQGLLRACCTGKQKDNAEGQSTRRKTAVERIGSGSLNGGLDVLLRRRGTAFGERERCEKQIANFLAGPRITWHHSALLGVTRKQDGGMKLNGFLLKSTIVAALGGLLFGFDTAVIAGAIDALKVLFSLSDWELGVTVSSALVGTVIGAMTAGLPGEKYGRRDSLRLMAVLYLVSSVGCAFAWNWPALLAFRIVGGLGIGGSSVLGPMYIAE